MKTNPDAGLVLVEDRGAVRVLTMNRPEKRNALNTALTRALLEHLRAADTAEPVVTAINGAAMGGGAGLAIAGDLAVMAQGARIGYPEVRHGIVAAIVMANLVRQIGRKKAFELVSLGEPLNSREAIAFGLVNRVVPDSDLLTETMKLAEKLASMNPAALRAAKRLFHEVADLPLEEALERGREANKTMRAFNAFARPSGKT